MESIYRNFYRHLYMQTGGYFPTVPFNRNILPGDFFQLRNGGQVVMGNIFRNGIIDKKDAEISTGIQLHPAGWNFGDGVTRAYSGRGTGEAPLGGQFQYSQQVLAFKENGSFLFAGNHPEAVKIVNWSDIWRQLIIRMTQGLYSFREVYVVTECASLSDFTLAIAGAAKAELEIASDSEKVSLTGMFGHSGARTIQSKEIEYYHREQRRKPAFYKARKLAVSDERKKLFINELLQKIPHIHGGYDDFLGYSIEEEPYLPQLQAAAQESVLDMLGVNELNANTALSYFKWTDAGLGDIEKLFISYGNNW